MKDYYKILEVNKSASPEIISKVYKILAKKYHPDLQDSENKSICEEKFKEISEAYEILSNENKRTQYNQQLEINEKKTSVDIKDYETLKNYCIQLENEIKQLKNTSSYNQYNNNSRTSYHSSERVAQQVQKEAYNDAINKAYHDAYVHNLKNPGNKIKYKKAFKETCQNLLSLIITSIIIYIIIKIIWSVPYFRDNIISFFTI